MSTTGTGTARLLDTLVDAFRVDPLYVWLFPDPAVRPQALRAVFTLMLSAADGRGDLDVADGGDAVAVWTPPGVDLLDDPAPFVELLDRWAPSRIDAALAGMAACARHLDPAAAVLHLAAVDPARQGGGLGSALLRPRLDALVADGTPACLDSSNERNVGFYRRLGFEVTAEVVVGDAGPVMRPMRRAAADR